MEPGLTVIIPTHDRCGLLPAAVRSAAGQTLKCIEIIVVDDGSSDATAKVVAQLAATDSRIRMIRQANLGLAAARNTGLAAARAPWVGFLDDDDLWHPEAAAALLALNENRESAAVSCHAVSFESTETDLDALEVLAHANDFRVQPWPPGPPVAQITCDDLVFRTLLPVNAALFRTGELRACGGFDATLRAAEDYDLWLRLTAGGPIPVLPRVLALVRRHGDQMSANVTRQTSELRLVLERFLDAHPELIVRLGRRGLRRRRALLAKEEAYGFLLAGDGPSTRRATLAGIALAPWLPKLWLYLLASGAPAAFGALRARLRN